MKERNRDVRCDLDKRTLRRLLPGTIEEEPQSFFKKITTQQSTEKRNEEKIQRERN